MAADPQPELRKRPRRFAGASPRSGACGRRPPIASGAAAGLARAGRRALPVTWGSLMAELRCVKGFTDVKPHLDNAWNKSLTFFTQLCTNRLGSSRVETAAPRHPRASLPVNPLKPSPRRSKVGPDGQRQGALRRQLFSIQD